MTKIEVKHSYNFPVDRVYSAFLDVNLAQKFMFRTAAGKLVKAEVSGEAGGSFLFSEQRNDILAEHFGTFVEVDTNHKISFVFAVQQDADQSDYVEIFFHATSTGCDVVLNHDLKIEYIDFKAKVTQGWVGMLEKLERVLSEHDSKNEEAIPKDSLGQALSEGDSVKTIKDLKVKGSSMVIKRGTVVKKIHLITGNDEEVDCRVEGVALSLETQWLVKI